jgi:hypothetical protein
MIVIIQHFYPFDHNFPDLPTSTLFFHKPFYDKDLHFFGGTTFLIV